MTTAMIKDEFDDDYLWLNIAHEYDNHECFYYFLSLFN